MENDEFGSLFCQSPDFIRDNLSWKTGWQAEIIVHQDVCLSQQ